MNISEHGKCIFKFYVRWSRSDNCYLFPLREMCNIVIQFGIQCVEIYYVSNSFSVKRKPAIPTYLEDKIHGNNLNVSQAEPVIATPYILCLNHVMVYFDF